ncbi:hypothetical protein V6N11_033802 [Hibiscus sabdariffa]|uniref:Uncharacterized protein n=1 Tax=Hibiscus sabdariffa TaxID=183260 RepID=A0ABR2S0X8_9ROSI
MEEDEGRVSYILNGRDVFSPRVVVYPVKDLSWVAIEGEGFDGINLEISEFSTFPGIMSGLNHVYRSPVLNAMYYAKALPTSQGLMYQSLVESKVDFESLALFPKPRIITQSKEDLEPSLEYIVVDNILAMDISLNQIRKREAPKQATKDADTSSTADDYMDSHSHQI